jgi:hypothetical protein
MAFAMALSTGSLTALKTEHKTGFLTELPRVPMKEFPMAMPTAYRTDSVKATLMVIVKAS